MRIWIAAALLLACGVVSPAWANYTFSSSDTNIAGTGSTWGFNAQSAAPANWGSPGVGQGFSAYGEATAAYGLELTFTGGGTIDSGQVTTGNSSNCGGGSIFCVQGFSSNTVWTGYRLGTESIEFLATTPSDALPVSGDYFTNVYFNGATPTGFTGTWFTQFTTVPEPASLTLLGSGMLCLGMLQRRRRS